MNNQLNQLNQLNRPSHNPDKGGDQAKFKDTSVAYENLNELANKSIYRGLLIFNEMNGIGEIKFVQLFVRLDRLKKISELSSL